MRRRRAITAVQCACIAILGASGHAHAGSFAWNNVTGNWSTGANWAGNVAPTGTDPTDALTFAGTGTSAYTATNDISASPFLLNQLLFDANSDTGSARIIQGNQLQLSGTNPAILDTGL